MHLHLHLHLIYAVSLIELSNMNFFFQIPPLNKIYANLGFVPKNYNKFRNGVFKKKVNFSNSQ